MLLCQSRDCFGGGSYGDHSSNALASSRAIFERRGGSLFGIHTYSTGLGMYRDGVPQANPSERLSKGLNILSGGLGVGEISPTKD